MFKGSYVAIATPFKKNNNLDEDGLRRNLRFLIQGGSHGIVPCATTGEGPSLSEEEYKTIIRIAEMAHDYESRYLKRRLRNRTQKAIAVISQLKYRFLPRISRFSVHR